MILFFIFSLRFCVEVCPMLCDEREVVHSVLVNLGVWRHGRIQETVSSQQLVNHSEKKNKKKETINFSAFFFCWFVCNFIFFPSVFF